MPLTLQITEGHTERLCRTYPEGQNILVGRDPEAHFRVSEEDLYFARRQFMLELAPLSYRLIDLKSKSGTHVNGVRVEATELKDGDVIKAGLKTKLLVRIEPTSAETVVPPSVPPVSGTVPQPDLPRSGTEVQQSLPQLRSGSDTDQFSIPGYQLLDELGRGGMGVVYRAMRESDRRIVAIKTIHPQIRPTTHAVSRFVREAEITRKLEHPGIVAGIDSGETRGILWLAMEFINGRDGYKILQSEGPLAIPRAVEWTRQLLDALGYAHDHDFVHRDVKPANMMISHSDSGERVHLTDFGLARAYQVSMMSAVTSGLTKAGNPLGTVKFMPLEQMMDARSVKPPADQYAAAATLYQLLTKKYLFENATNEMEWYIQILEGTPTPIQKHRPEIPDPLAKAIHQALSRKPESRFRDVREFSQAIQEATGR